jgi:hypothetical protein
MPKKKVKMNNSIKQDDQIEEYDHDPSKWKAYLEKYPRNHREHHRELALTQDMKDRESSGRILYHLSLTYKPYQDNVYDERQVNNFFNTFYLKHFLPHVFESTKYFRPNKRPFQPVCYAFIDEHAHKPKINWKRHAYGELEPRGQFAERLHHHAILAVHPDTNARVVPLIGENTLATGMYSPIVMTSYLRICEPMCLLYASKKLHKYPDFLMFSGEPRIQSSDEPYEQKRRALAELNLNGHINYATARSAINAINKNHQGEQRC